MSIFETKDQKELLRDHLRDHLRDQELEREHKALMMQMQMQMQIEQQKMAAAYYNGAISGSGLQAPPSPSKINEALDFKDWVRDTLPDVWDQYRAVKDIERCSK